MATILSSPAVTPPRQVTTFRETMLPPVRLVPLAIGLVFWWAALVPSQLPRSALLQGAMGAVCFCVGYGVGALVTGSYDALLRVARRPNPFARLYSRTFTVVRWLAVLAAFGGAFLWVHWQNDQAPLVGNAADHGPLDVVVIIVVAAVVTAIVLGISRLLGYAVAAVGRRLPGGLTPFASRAVSIAIVALVSYAVVRVVLSVGFMGWANDQFGEVDETGPPGVSAPSSTTVSGGPGSLVPWSTLGAEGRSFTASSTSVADLQSFEPASTPREPVRVYVGLDSAPTSQARADLAVRELERTGAFQRKVLVVATVTGTGWVDPVTAAGVEYLHDGDTAIVAQQYSFLPSWISFITDRAKAAEAGRVLFDTVQAKWATLPADSRPTLIAYGLSLGSFGSEAAFGKATFEQSLTAATTKADAVLWMGPTNDNAVWQQLIAARNPGSPVWHPVYGDGVTVRLAAQVSDLPATGPKAKALWVQHPSDPVGWWGWDVLWSKPGWMTQPTGPDVPRDPTFFPFVTWLQQTVDLMNGFNAQPGHGHNYDPNVAGAWVTVTSPDGWTDADSARLTARLLTIADE